MGFSAIKNEKSHENSFVESDRKGYTMQKADHSGHRARMREKYLKSGLDVFAPHEILELLLFYAVPYKNTNDIAKNLISRFGSLDGVLDAPVDSLVEAGLTENQAVYLKLYPDVTRIYYNAKYDTDHGPIDYDDLPDYILRRYIGLTSQEHVLLILLDTKGREVFSGFISDGNFETTRFSVRSIVRLAMNYGAKMAILAHNHPSGVALPSKEDLNTTVYLREALSLVDVDLIDHFIVANEECISLAQSGWM